MKINCHSHIFNVQSVMTPETVGILLSRLKRERMPDDLRDVLEKKLAGYLSKTISREDLLASLADKIDLAGQLKKLAQGLPGGAVGLDAEINGLIAGAGGRLAQLLWQKLISSYDHDDEGRPIQNWLDYLLFIRMAFQPSLADTADLVMQELDKDAAIVALMMDILREEDKDDDKQFLKQINDTSDMILAYPGRIFGFVKVNPIRTNHYLLMQTALEQKGFWGVKLYPSLGYEPDRPELIKVYEYCAANGVPVLMHCNHGGFKRDDTTSDLCNPARWRDILARPSLSGLKICFGHFGGNENLTKPEIDPDSWTGTILSLMKQCSGVYADISFHTDPMVGCDGMSADQCQANYLNNITGMLMQDDYKDRILFGTDTWLVRMVCGEADYWQYYRSKLGEGVFTLISETNPANYLGLPGSNQPNDWLIKNHLNFLASKKWRVQRDPAAWLEAERSRRIGPSAQFIITGAGPTWSSSDPVHLQLFAFLLSGNKQFYGSDLVPQLSYEEYGRFKLCDLKYWETRAEPDSFETAVDSFARNLDDWMVSPARNPRMKYNSDGKMDGGESRSRLRSALNNGDMRLYEFAQLCNRCYVLA